MKSKSTFHYVVAIDRSDSRLDVCVAERKGSAQPERHVVDNTPEALSVWFKQLRAERPRRRPAVIFEQPAAELLAFFGELRGVVVYPINPKVLAKFREAFNTSRAKDDRLDAYMLSELLKAHSDKLRRYMPDTPAARRIASLVEARRGEVDRRTSQTNRLKSLLKKTFPQALNMVGRDLWRPAVLAFLARWPTLEELSKASREELVAFYRRSHCDRGDTVKNRLLALENAVAATKDRSILDVARIQILACVRHAQLCSEVIEQYDEQVRLAFAEHPDSILYSSLPGAGAVFAPRLLAALGEDRDRFDSSAALQRFSGVAPVTKQSGGKRLVQRRYCRPKFTMQTFVEYAKESVTYCSWAKAFWDCKKSAGMSFNCAMRELAFKWQRIIYRMWKDRVPYDDERYLQCLKSKRSPICDFL